MNKQTIAAVVIGLGIVAAIVSGILLSTRQNRVELKGEILKVRSHQIDPEHTLALLDIRVQNPSTQQFVVREVEIFVDEPDGKSTPVDVFAEGDIQRVIDYYPTIGKKYSPGLLRRDKINSGESLDRSMAISAPMTDERLQKRKALRVVVHDVDGAKAEIVERRAERS
jgi:hypothetical protein